MNPLNVNFERLYRRHLCRHGHFGINILHLIAVAGIYVPLFGVVDAFLSLAGVQHRLPILAVLTLPWFLTVAVNVPVRVSVVTAIFVAGLLGLFALVPTSVSPILLLVVGVVMILLMHQFQQYSHRIYHMDRDMSEFEADYPKGRQRFVLLLFYELPILLNYLLFGRADWVWRTKTDESATSSGQTTSGQTA